MLLAILDIHSLLTDSTLKSYAEGVGGGGVHLSIPSGNKRTSSILVKMT